MKEVQKPVYIADDGQEFTNKKECEAYEQKIAEELSFTHYFSVPYNFDGTEGRGYYRRKLLKVYFPIKYSHVSVAKAALEDHLHEVLGKKLMWIMGVSPAENWKIVEITAEKFNNTNEGREGMATISKQEMRFDPQNKQFHDEFDKNDTKLGVSVYR